MTAVDVAAIRAALDKATPSDWVREGSEVYRGCTCNGEFLTSTTHDADAELIVLLRNNAEALLDALDDGYCAGYDHGVEDQMDRQEAALAEAERRGAAKALRTLSGDYSVLWPSILRERANAIERGEVSP